MSDEISDRLHCLAPHLVVSDGPRAIQFYRRAFGAVELYRLRNRQGKIAHAELVLAGARLTLSDEAPDGSSRSARSYGGSSVVLRLYVPDIEVSARNFLGAGGFVVQPVRDHVQGDRLGQFRDPEGYHWALAQHLEDLTLDQLEQRISTLGLSLWRPRTTESRRSKPPPPSR